MQNAGLAAVASLFPYYLNRFGCRVLRFVTCILDFVQADVAKLPDYDVATGNNNQTDKTTCFVVTADTGNPTATFIDMT